MIDPAFLAEHRRLTRRYFVRRGAAGVTAFRHALLFSWVGKSLAASAKDDPAARPTQDKAGARQDPYFTPQVDFRDVSRGKPLPHSLPESKKSEVGLTRDSWRLEVIADPDNPPRLGTAFSRSAGNAIDFDRLLEIGQTRAVRFAKVMTCLNIGCPLGMGLWEGVPLREVVWLTQPQEKLRRVFYYGYHNDDPAQMFRSSLPIGRVLEEPFDLPPVILCYKLNGQWLDSERGGPVRMVVPEAYGFKSVKWVSHVVLTNLAHANDTYADADNDIDSPIKTFAAFLDVVSEVPAGHPIAVSGYAQVGLGGLSRVQVWVQRSDDAFPKNDVYYTQAPWRDAEVLPAPRHWGDLPDGQVPAGTHGFDEQGRPRTWPLRFTKAHWAALLPGLPAGKYTLRCRSIDEKGFAQPMPRPLRKGGHAAIEAVDFQVISEP